MAAKRVSPQEWAVIRKHWEEDPALNYAQLAAQVGMTRQAIKQRADREGWQKSLQAVSVEQAAHALADERLAKVTENAVDEATQAANVYVSESGEPLRHAQNPEFVPVDLTRTPDQAAAVVLDSATQQRAALIENHRKEWTYARAVVYAAIKARGKQDALTQARYAKTVVEALKILQDGERMAFGLNGEGGGKTPPPAATIVVHQQPGVKLG